MSRQYTIVTPENVTIKYEIAGIGSRFLAILIDSCLQGSMITGIYFCLELIGVKELSLQTEILAGFGVSVFTGLMLLFVFFIVFGYHILLEAAMNGQTVGKRIVSIRVRKEGGYATGFWSILLRNLIRPVDFLPFFYSLGVLTMFLNKKAKRLGDYAAGTIVVKELPAKKLATFLAEETETETPENETAEKESNRILFRHPWLSQILPSLTSDEFQVLRELYSRRKELTNFPFLAQDLLAKISGRLSAPKPPALEKEEIERILAAIIKR